MDIKDWLIIGAVGFAWLNKEKLKEALNPGNDNNIFNTAANAALGLDNKTASIGTKANDLVTAILEPDKKYAGYPHKYDMKAGVAYVLFNGQWMVDTYETAKLKAEQKAKNSKPTIQVRRIGKSNQWEKLVSGKWTPFSAADYKTYLAIVGPSAGPKAAPVIPALLKPGAGNKTSPFNFWN
jgi:hypothetical protein